MINFKELNYLVLKHPNKCRKNEKVVSRELSKLAKFDPYKIFKSKYFKTLVYRVSINVKSKENVFFRQKQKNFEF